VAVALTARRAPTVHVALEPSPESLTPHGVRFPATLPLFSAVLLHHSPPLRQATSLRRECWSLERQEPACVPLRCTGSNGTSCATTPGSDLRAFLAYTSYLRPARLHPRCSTIASTALLRELLRCGRSVRPDPRAS
jgi:hypothetical protein